MALDRSIPARGPGATRLAAALVCALALCLLVWRGAALLTGPGAPAAATPAEAALADVLAPVAGPGLSRLSLGWNADGSRTLLILLDETAAPRRAELQRIAPLAAGLDPERGDRLVIETVAFAEGIPGRPGASAWAELAALGALVLLGGALVLLTGRPQPAAAPAAQLLSLPASSPAERPREAPRPLRAVPADAPADAASEIARRDPARAASVVRGWMTTKDETA